MESLLNDVNAVIGVTGSFVGDRKGRILARVLPSVYDDGSLEIVARTMMQTFTGLETARRRKVGDIDMVFREGRLIMKPFSEGCLGIVCVPRFNIALLNLTANVTLRKIHEELKQKASAQAAVVALPAAGPAVPVHVNSPRESAALALVQAARERNLLLRVMGDTAVRLRCPTASAFPATEDDEIVEFAARGRQSGELERLMKDRGINPDARFNMLHGSERLRFVDPQAALPIEVFLNALEAFHRIELADRLELDEITLPLSDLILTLLQLVNFTPQDQKRILALLADHEVGTGADMFDAGRVAEVCADDWGWYKTVTVNLEKAIAAAPSALKAEQAGLVEQRARRMIKAIEEAPKSMGWQVRARLGERRVWYTVPE